jgi:hypothetical protein
MQVGFCTCTGAKLKMMRGRASIGAMMALPSTGLTVILTFCFIFVSLRIESYLLPNKNIPLFYSIIMICYLYLLFVPAEQCFGSGSGSVCFWVSGSGSFRHQAKKVRNLISTIL